jgi:cytoskeleton protein RodZ
LLAGETVAASGTLPLAVVVGRVDVIEAEVRGKPFSLAGVSKDNVARFEVK